jgi:hypothetical protein
MVKKERMSTDDGDGAGRIGVRAGAGTATIAPQNNNSYAPSTAAATTGLHRHIMMLPITCEPIAMSVRARAALQYICH